MLFGKDEFGKDEVIDLKPNFIVMLDTKEQMKNIINAELAGMVMDTRVSGSDDDREVLYSLWGAADLAERLLEIIDESNIDESNPE